MSILHSSTEADHCGTPMTTRTHHGSLRGGLLAGLLSTLACVSFTLGCGSKGAAEGETSSSADESSGGESKVSVKAGGTGSTQAVSKQAEADWKEALAAFEAAEKGGWDAAKC